jgi:hypothetical protein
MMVEAIRQAEEEIARKSKDEGIRIGKDEGRHERDHPACPADAQPRLCGAAHRQSLGLVRGRGAWLAAPSKHKHAPAQAGEAH